MSDSDQDLFLGIDIGGTKIASGVLDARGNIIETKFLATLGNGEKEGEILGQVFNSIDSFGQPLINRIKAIGIGVPGPTREGILINPPNIPSWRNVNLKKIIEERYQLPVLLENDANAAGYAEMVFGAAQGYKNFVYITISTGIGTAIVIDGKVYRGKNSLAGEGGHVVINYDSPDQIDSGINGSIENSASGTAMARKVRTRLENNPELETELLEYVNNDLEKISATKINQAAINGDEFAYRMIRETGFKLGIWIGSLISLLDPELIVIGGGISKIGNLLFDKIKKTAPKYTINTFASETEIVQAMLLENVGIYGAASLVIK